MAGDGGGGAAHAGKAGAAHAGMGSGGDAGSNEGGSAGIDSGGGEAGTADAGSGGEAGDASVELGLEIATPNLATGKTYVPFTGTITASGAAHYTWTISSGTLPAGLTLQTAQSGTATIAGTPTEAGQFPISLSVTDGSTTKSVAVTLAITHPALFLSDRTTIGVTELFLGEVGTGAAAPVQLSASLSSGGGVSSYAWSPDGSKVMYLAKQAAGGATELWVASFASPGIAQRVSAPGVNVRQMTWFTSGNIAAYTTSTCETSLVDLSGSVPGVSKVAIPASTSLPAGLAPSPSGNSLGVASAVSETTFVTQFTYVSWNSGVPKSIPFGEAMAYGGYSYDGRYVLSSSNGVGSWTDLSLPTLTQVTLGHSFSAVWSAKANTLLYVGGALSGNEPIALFRGTFNAGILTPTVLASGTCPSMGVAPWPPDEKNVVFGCDQDVRGISNVATAVANADFSLLPSGFLSRPGTQVEGVSWSSDSQWIALRADRDIAHQYDLYLIRWSAPGVAYKPHANSIAPGVSNWAFAPNSPTIALVGTIAPQTNTGLYLTKLPATGAPPVATLVSSPGAVVQTDINWLPGSRVLTYRAAVSGATQLFALPVAADGTPGSPISISGVSGSGVTSYQLAPTR